MDLVRLHISLNWAIECNCKQAFEVFSSLVLVKIKATTICDTQHCLHISVFNIYMTCTQVNRTKARKRKKKLPHSTWKSQNATVPYSNEQAPEEYWPKHRETLINAPANGLICDCCKSQAHFIKLRPIKMWVCVFFFFVASIFKHFHSIGIREMQNIQSTSHKMHMGTNCFTCTKIKSNEYIVNSTRFSPFSWQTWYILCQNADFHREISFCILESVQNKRKTEN